jgi:hypothetical protein
MSQTLPECPEDLDSYSIRWLMGFVDTQMPGWKWLVRSHHGADRPAGYFANMIPPPNGPGRMERYPVYDKTPERALATAIRLALNTRHALNVA